MLGAELGQMGSLASRMALCTSQIGGVQSATNSSTGRVVSEVNADASAALRQVEASLADLRGSVIGAVSQANATQWTGRNAETFRAAATEFDGAMQRAEAATTDAFSRFQSSIQQMADALADYQANFSAALAGAQQSTGSMQRAVEQQAAMLDSTMNQGLAVG